MALATWPTGVSLLFEAGSYQEVPERSIDSFQTEHGPPLENIATAIPTTLISGTIKCDSSDEYEELLTFWETTLVQGLKHFTRVHPRTLLPDQEFKFQEFQLASGTASGIYYVRVVLRYFPSVV